MSEYHNIGLIIEVRDVLHKEEPSANKKSVQGRPPQHFMVCCLGTGRGNKCSLARTRKTSSSGIARNPGRSQTRAH